jgi:hypothetical protein
VTLVELDRTRRVAGADEHDFAHGDRRACAP